MLPDFKHLNSDYDAKGVRDALKPLIEELGKGIPEKMSMVGLGSGDLSKRWKTLIDDVMKRADHAGIHGFKHDLKLHGGDFAEEILLFIVEQAVVLAQLNPDIKDKLEKMAGDEVKPKEQY